MSLPLSLNNYVNKIAKKYYLAAMIVKKFVSKIVKVCLKVKFNLATHLVAERKLSRH